MWPVSVFLSTVQWNYLYRTTIIKSTSFLNKLVTKYCLSFSKEILQFVRYLIHSKNQLLPKGASTW